MISQFPPYRSRRVQPSVGLVIGRLNPAATASSCFSSCLSFSASTSARRPWDKTPPECTARSGAGDLSRAVGTRISAYVCWVRLLRVGRRGLSRTVGCLPHRPGRAGLCRCRPVSATDHRGDDGRNFNVPVVHRLVLHPRRRVRVRQRPRGDPVSLRRRRPGAALADRSPIP